MVLIFASLLHRRLDVGGRVYGHSNDCARARPQAPDSILH